MPVTVECSWCGSETNITPAKAASNERHFCDKECYTEWQTGRPRPEIWKSVEVECAHCGSEKTVYPWKAEQSDRLFCDMACYGAFYRDEGSVEVICEYCGATVLRPRNEVNAADRLFCDKDCYAKWQSENRSGENSPTYKGGHEPYYGPDWKSARRRAIERDSERCFLCGLSRQANHAVYGRDLEVHHVVSRTGGGDNGLGNLITLCRRCHYGIE